MKLSVKQIAKGVPMRFEHETKGLTEQQRASLTFALSLFCPEGQSPSVDGDGVLSIELAANASVAEARIVAAIALQPDLNAESPTTPDEALII